AMWERGFVEEVRSLINKGITSAKTARAAQAALGYAQVIKFAKGELSQSEAKEETKRATRQYARRQETWFSRDERVTWIKGGSRQQMLEEIISSTISPR
ncbi:MAG: tRNA (adenosine(37)-N6)-dimethylallyltransferase MiaA, partial [Actinomycetota bacterium]